MTYRLACVALAVVVVVVASTACSGESSAIAPADAAARIVGELRFPDSVTPCLEAQFDESAAARRALDPEVAPSDAELDALSGVVATCVPADVFATSVSAQMATGYRTVAEIPAEKEQCLREEMAALSGDDRGLFVTGPVARLRDPASDRSLAVSALLARLLAACDIDVTSGPTSPTSTP